MHLIAIGSLERRDFTEEGLQAVIEAGDVVFEQDGAIVVQLQSTAERQPVGEGP